jgi:hypothetical protein
VAMQSVRIDLTGAVFLLTSSSMFCLIRTLGPWAGMWCGHPVFFTAEGRQALSASRHTTRL